jgi:zinc-ribbon domain
MRCSRCGFENPAGFAFCAQCGTSLPGHPLASVLPAVASRPQTPQGYTPTYLAEKIRTSRVALEGERKQVTVLFADLKGAMELLAGRDPTAGGGVGPGQPLRPGTHQGVTRSHRRV